MALLAFIASLVSLLGFAYFRFFTDGLSATIFWGCFGLGALGLILGSITRATPMGNRAMWLGILDVAIGIFLLLYFSIGTGTVEPVPM